MRNEEKYNMRSMWIKEHNPTDTLTVSLPDIYTCPYCGNSFYVEYYKCPWCHTQMLFPKRTNGDKIRKMSNEELAMILQHQATCPVKNCPSNEFPQDCYKCWIDYLNKEVEE